MAAIESHANSDIGNDPIFSGKHSSLFAQIMLDNEPRTYFLQAVLSENFGKGREGLMSVVQGRDIVSGVELRPTRDKPLTLLEVAGVKLEMPQEWTEASFVVALRKVIRAEGDIDEAIFRVKPPLAN